MKHNVKGKRFDKSTNSIENTEQNFSGRLTLLSEVTNELSKQKSPDDLHRRVVELGHEKLDLDRLTLLFITKDRQSIRGSFGVDNNGNITNERGSFFPIEATSRIQRIVRGEELILRYNDAPLYLNGRVVGKGTRILAGMWDGECVIGFMSVDNLLRKRPFTDQDEEFIRLYAIAVAHLCSLKIAEEKQKKLQAQLLQAQKMECLGRVAGGVAHDFNNMLSVIICLTELASDKLEPGHPVRNDLQEINRTAQRSSDLTGHLLAFARKQVAVPKSLDLNSAVPELLKMISRILGPEIEVNWQPCSRLWTILLDPVQLDQILANLCVNARDAIKGNGHISITTNNITLDEAFCERFHTSVPGDYVLLTISDDGCGMTEAIKARIFEPFFTTKKLGQGTGLGLATVYGIIKQNNGIIRFESEPGCGTSFFIYFPRLVSPNSSTDKHGPPAEIESEGGETILLVEQEPTLLDLNRRYLEKKGYTVLCSETPEKSLKIADTHKDKIDLLITNMVMPGMNGYDLARKLSLLHPQIKLLFMSGFESDIILGEDIATDPRLNFLQKPFSMNDLGSRVQKILNSQTD